MSRHVRAREARRAVIHRKMDTLRVELHRSMQQNPEDFAVREVLWTRREALRNDLHNL